MEFKSENGITLTSLIIYVFAMFIIVNIITVLTGYFYQNFDIIETKEDFNFKYTRVMNYFSKEVNLDENEIISIEVLNENDEYKKQYTILFESGNQYTYIPKNKSLYFQTYKICDGIDDVTFNLTENSNKQNLEITIKQDEITQSVKYTIVKN